MNNYFIAIQNEKISDSLNEDDDDDEEDDIEAPNIVILNSLTHE